MADPAYVQPSQATSQQPRATPCFIHEPYSSAHPYLDSRQTPYTMPATETPQPPPQQHPAPATPSIIPAQSVTREKYQSPVIAQPGSDWAKDLVRLAKNEELKKHTLTLQLHTAHILSAHSSLEQRHAKLESTRAERTWLESERARLLDCLRQVNEDREKVDLAESTVLKEINESEHQIKTITEGEYSMVRKQVDAIRSELGLSPLPGLQATLEKRSSRSPNRSSVNKRCAAHSISEKRDEVPTISPSMDSRPSLYSVAQANKLVPVKRGPGRPCKALTGDNDTPGPAITIPDGQPTVKRPRGRPRGSKNKPKVISPEEAAAVP